MSSLSSSSEKLRCALEELRLGKYWAQFLSEEIDAAALCCISSEAELGHLGVLEADRAPLMKWINDTVSGDDESSTPSPGSTRSSSGAAAEATIQVAATSSSSSSFSSESSPTSSPSLNSTMNPTAREFKPPAMSLAPPPREYAEQGPSSLNTTGMRTEMTLAPVHNLSSLDNYYGNGGDLGGMQHGSGIIPMGGLHYEHGFNPYHADMMMTMMTQQQGGGRRNKKKSGTSRRRAQDYSMSRGGGGRRNGGGGYQGDSMPQMNTYDSRVSASNNYHPQDQEDRPPRAYNNSNSNSNSNGNGNRSFRGDWPCPGCGSIVSRNDCLPGERECLNCARDELKAAGPQRGSTDKNRQYPDNNNNHNHRHHGPSYETPPRSGTDAFGTGVLGHADEGPRPIHEQRQGGSATGNYDPASLAKGSPSSVAGDTDTPPSGRTTLSSVSSEGADTCSGGSGGGESGAAKSPPQPVTESEARKVALVLGLPDNKESIETVQTLLALQAQNLKKQHEQEQVTDTTTTMCGDPAGSSIDTAGPSTTQPTHQQQRQEANHATAVAPLDNMDGGARAGHTGRSSALSQGQRRGGGGMGNGGGGGGGGGSNSSNRRSQSLPPPTIETIVPLFATVDYEQLTPAACEVAQAANDARREELFAENAGLLLGDTAVGLLDGGASEDGARVGRGSHAAQAPHRNLYVANFGDVLGEQDIEQLFGCFAEVRRVVMKDVIDKPTGDVKGVYAFVWTGGIDQSSRARLALHNTRLKNGRKLQVKFAKEGSFKITSLTVTTDGDGNHHKELVTLRADDEREDGGGNTHQINNDALSSHGRPADYYDQRQPSSSRLGGGGNQGLRTPESSEDGGQFRGRGGLFPRGSFSGSGGSGGSSGGSGGSGGGGGGGGGGTNSSASYYGGFAGGAPPSAAVLALRQQYGVAGSAAGRLARAPPPPPPGFKGFGAKNAQTSSWKPPPSSYLPQPQQGQYPPLSFGTLDPWDQNATPFH